MKIEVVEYYPYEKKSNDFIGTLHVFVEDNGVMFDLRGIGVKKMKKGYFFQIPMRKLKDLETGEDVCFTVFSYLDREKQRAMIYEVQKQGTQYLNKLLRPAKKLFQPAKKIFRDDRKYRKF